MGDVEDNGKCCLGVGTGQKRGVDRAGTEIHHSAEGVRVVRRGRRECSRRVLPRGRDVVFYAGAWQVEG